MQEGVREGPAEVEVSPCISPYLPVSPYISLDLSLPLPTSPYISDKVMVYISLHLHISRGAC